MATAQVAWDLAGLSEGRFVLGLGTQVKGHIERRYSTKWEAPVPRLREYVQSLRAIFECWSKGGTKLKYEGKFYNFSLMTPFFTPPKHDWPNVPIYIRGRQRAHFLRLAGEACDGLHAHPFNSPKYLTEFVLPNVDKGLKKAGRARKAFLIAASAYAIVGHNQEEQTKVREQVRQQISFYASHPHLPRRAPKLTDGARLHDRLNEKGRQGRMGYHGQ